ncbi:PTS transporter subunit IIC [Endozoicomonas arenosclerae]|uniref:PTS transporter subunit IIC n=1 Tax=Endozoicomonas arenosclerae TaxID=1633495 RepID=UPI0007853A8C|nr:PTS transporter subunit IIC [Endozoicomonas arenosclerae]
MLELLMDVLSTPAILIGLVALIGLAIQKKPAPEVVKGTIKTILGFLVIGGGAGILVAAITPMGTQGNCINSERLSKAAFSGAYGPTLLASGDS